MESLDPRVARLPQVGTPGELKPKAPLDQLGTFEVFVQPTETKPFQHEGAVHAPNLEMAFILAKETFTRRFTCVSLYVCDTRDVIVSPLSEGNVSVDLSKIESIHDSVTPEVFEVFGLVKRGKQMVHIATTNAAGPLAAMKAGSEIMNTGKFIFGWWAIARKNIQFTSDDEKDFWI